MQIQQYDTVLLKDGRIGCIIEINSETNFDVDIGDSPDDWETLYGVPLNDIAEVIRNN